MSTDTSKRYRGKRNGVCAVAVPQNLEHFKDCVQECTSWILFKNKPFVRQLVDEWFEYNRQEDCASYIKNKDADREIESEFRVHRGDQSILTLLLRKYDMTNLMETLCKNVFSIYIR